MLEVRNKKTAVIAYISVEDRSRSQARLIQVCEAIDVLFARFSYFIDFII